jgi:hypothetical protein
MKKPVGEVASLTATGFRELFGVGDGWPNAADR